MSQSPSEKMHCATTILKMMTILKKMSLNPLRGKCTVQPERGLSYIGDMDVSIPFGENALCNPAFRDPLYKRPPDPKIANPPQDSLVGTQKSSDFCMKNAEDLL